LAALTGHRLLFRDGLPVAWLAGGEVEFLTTLDPTAQWQARKLLLRSPSPAILADLA
jgi:ATP-dependent Lhr-like helicase